MIKKIKREKISDNLVQNNISNKDIDETIDRYHSLNEALNGYFNSFQIDTETKKIYEIICKAMTDIIETKGEEFFDDKSYTQIYSEIKDEIKNQGMLTAINERWILDFVESAFYKGYMFPGQQNRLMAKLNAAIVKINPNDPKQSENLKQIMLAITMTKKNQEEVGKNRNIRLVPYNILEAKNYGQK